MSSWIERHFGLIIVIGLATSILWPQPGLYLQGTLSFTLIMVLTVTFLNIDFLEVVAHIKRPYFVTLVSIFHLLIIPTMVFFVCKPFGIPFAVAARLLFAMPAGATSSAVTTVVRGNTALSLSITIVQY